LCRYDKVAFFVKKCWKTLDKSIIEKYEFLSEYDGRRAEIFRIFCRLKNRVFSVILCRHIQKWLQKYRWIMIKQIQLLGMTFPNYSLREELQLAQEALKNEKLQLF